MRVLRRIAKINHPVILHVNTVKGRGCQYAVEDPRRFHSPSAFDAADAAEDRFSPLPNWTVTCDGTFIAEKVSAAFPAVPVCAETCEAPLAEAPCPAVGFDWAPVALGAFSTVAGRPVIDRIVNHARGLGSPGLEGEEVRGGGVLE